MKKKLLIFLLALILGLAFVGCGTTESPTKKYIVNFYVGNEIFKTYEYENGENLVLPTEPTKDGYDFEKWYSDKNFSIPLKSGFTITSDISFYANFTENIIKYSYNSSNDSYTVTGFWRSDVTELIIPTMYKNKKITSISKNALNGFNNLLSLTIPFINSNTKFDYIFNNQNIPSSLKNVTISGGFSIGREAFKNCTDITTVSILEGVNAISNSAFENCTSLTQILLPTGLLTIEDYAFKNCFQLKSVTMPHTITKFGIYIFQDCSNLSEVNLPTNLSRIYQGMFSGCSKLQKINIPDSVITIDYSSFENSGLYGDITFSRNIKSIYGGAFSGCNNLTRITIPNSITSIGMHVFGNCSKLSNIYCEAEKRPSNWDTYWNGSDAQVVWNYAIP